MILRPFRNSHVARVAILRVPAPVLVIRRFGCEPWHQTRAVPLLGPDGKATVKQLYLHCLQRLHTIDACQANELGVAAKYGPNFGNGVNVHSSGTGPVFSASLASANTCKRRL